MMHLQTCGLCYNQQHVYRKPQEKEQKESCNRIFNSSSPDATMLKWRLLKGFSFAYMALSSLIILNYFESIRT